MVRLQGAEVVKVQEFNYFIIIIILKEMFRAAKTVEER